MSVVGIDIGNNCYVGVARAGGIETVPNEYSDRCSPAVVGFTRLQRVVGTSAKKSDGDQLQIHSNTNKKIGWSKI